MFSYSTSFVSKNNNAVTAIRSMVHWMSRAGTNKTMASTVSLRTLAQVHLRPMMIPSMNHSAMSMIQCHSSTNHHRAPFVAVPKIPDAMSTTTTMTYHTSTIAEQADVMTTTIPTNSTTTSGTSLTMMTTSTWMNRWIVTGEVAISKIFPGGFGWQTGSLIAANYYQYSSEYFNFALCTGIGDALGVFGGHCLYYYMKQSMVPSSSINMLKEVHTGLWLGCAAFCSGTVWQPIVTTLQLSGCTFTQVMIGTWLTCSTAFYIGLRAGRTILPLSTLAKPTYDNSQTDVALSISIGGATGFFVGTDTAYLPEQNFLLPIVGITDTTSDVMGCTLAGTSTALGFVSSQSALNIVYPKQKCWND